MTERYMRRLSVQDGYTIASVDIIGPVDADGPPMWGLIRVEGEFTVKQGVAGELNASFLSATAVEISDWVPGYAGPCRLRSRCNTADAKFEFGWMSVGEITGPAVAKLREQMASA